MGRRGMGSATVDAVSRAGCRPELLADSQPGPNVKEEARPAAPGYRAELRRNPVNVTHGTAAPRGFRITVIFPPCA